MSSIILPTTSWIRNKLVDQSSMENFLTEVSNILRNGEDFLDYDVQPNFYYNMNNKRIIGWITEGDDPSHLFIGISGKESWIYAEFS